MFQEYPEALYAKDAKSQEKASCKSRKEAKKKSARRVKWHDQGEPESHVPAELAVRGLAVGHGVV